MKEYTVEEKYKFLLSKLDIHDVDYWEQDALIGMPSTYFQFNGQTLPSADDVVKALMNNQGA